MKLHLPVKLRASLIAAVIAVSASVYNARAVEYVAPSDNWKWNTNDMELTETYLKTSGNTYTATSVNYPIYELDGKNRKLYAALLDVNGSIQKDTYGNTIGDTSKPLTEIGGALYITDGQGQNVLYTGEYGYNKLSDASDTADIIISAAAPEAGTGKLVTYINGDTQLTSSDNVIIKNSVKSGSAELTQDNKMAFKGNTQITTNHIEISKDKQGQGSRVVLEDVSIKDYDKENAADPKISTTIGELSSLVIVDGNKALTDEEKQVLNLEDITYSEYTRSEETEREVTLGAVDGEGSLAVIGNKDRVDTTDGTTALYDKVGEDAKDGIDLSITSIGKADQTFGNVAIANADAAVTSDIKNVTTLGLVNSTTTVGGSVSAYGIDVNTESGLTATKDISNRTNEGAGHVSIYGKVVSEEGSIDFSNGKETNGAGIHEGAYVKADVDVRLSNVDTKKAAHLEAGDKLNITTNSTVKETTGVLVGGDMQIENNSSFEKSTATVGGNVIVTDKAAGSAIDTPVGSSSITGSRITVTNTRPVTTITDGVKTVVKHPDGSPETQTASTVTIANGSTMTDSFIMGAKGDITIGGEGTDKATGTAKDTVVGVSAEALAGESPVSADFISKGDDMKGNLAAILDKAKNTDKGLLTEAGINDTGKKVGSMIGNTAGNVTITKDAKVTSTVITAGGAIAIGDMAAAEGTEKGTLVSGVIIDARGNLGTGDKESGLDYSAGGTDNSLSIGDSTVSDSILLGVTGAIKVKDSDLSNSYVHGGASTSVTDGSTMTDSFIMETKGDVTIGTADKATTVGISAESGASEDFITSRNEDGTVADKKGNLSAILALTPSVTEAGINGTGKKVGSMIESSTGNVTIAKDAKVSSTVITAGGDVTIGSTDTTDNAALMDQILAQLPSITQVGTQTAQFDTQVNGSIIDVRGNLPLTGDSNALTIGDSSVTNSIILGITGDIRVKDSVLNNDYIDGGAGVSIEDSAIIDTNIVNLQADIKISGEAKIVTSDAAKPWAMNTKGTAGYTDKDTYTGGSIILDHTTLSNGVLKSGYLATYNPAESEDGTGFKWTKVPDAGETLTGDPSDDSTATTGSTGKHMPYGEIIAKDASLTHMDIETVRGNVSLSSPTAVKTNAPYTPDGYVNYTATLTTTIAELVDDTLNASTGGVVINELSVQGRSVSSGNAPKSVQMKLVYTDIAGNEHTVYSTNTINWANGSAFNRFTFEDVANVDPNETLTIQIVNSGTDTAVSVGLSVKSGGDKVTVLGQSGWGSAIMTGKFNCSTILASDIKSGDGGLNADKIIVDSLVEVEGANAKETKTTISVTEESEIRDSTINGADISVKKDGTTPSLSLMNSIVQGNVRLDVGGTITVSEGTQFALNGDRRGEGKRDASITAASLVLGDLYNSVSNDASLSNGTIAISGYTSLKDGNTFTLSNVKGAKPEGEQPEGVEAEVVETEVAGQLGHVTEMDKGTVGDRVAKLVITKGSVIETGRIDAVREDAADTTALTDYFDHVAVDGDSVVTVKDIALIETYNQDDTLAQGEQLKNRKGSKVTFEKDAWLKEATISGLGNHKPTGQFGAANAVPLTQTTIKGAAHIGTLRLDDDGIVNLKATAADTTSYIANLLPGVGKDEVHGTINVVGETLKTPKLSSTWLSLGLNGGTVILDEVSAADGATVASTADSKNAHVTLREITNAQALTGTNKATEGRTSTIKTTLNRLTEASSSSMGEAVTKKANVYLYVVTRDVTIDGVLLPAGTIIGKPDLVSVSEDIPLLGNVATGVVAVDAATLTTDEQSYLSRVTNPVPVLGEDGQQVVDEEGRPVWEVTVDGQGNTLTIVGQLTTTQDIVIYPDATGTFGSMDTVDDGIASLTVKQDFDADYTTIKAYQTGREVVDEGTGTTRYEPTEGNSGFITIEGDLTGEHNTLIADNNISIRGIIAEGQNNQTEGETTVVVPNTENVITSNGGNITIGANGINASRNTLTATKGAIAVNGKITGDSNTLIADTTITTVAIEGDSNKLGVQDSETETDPVIATDTITVNGAITGDSNKLKAEETITTGKITGDTNTLTAGTTITTAGIDGDSNKLTAQDSITVTSAVEGDSNVLTATGKTTGEGEDATFVPGYIAMSGDLEGNNNVLAATGAIMTGKIKGNENDLDAGTSILASAIEGNKNTLDAGTTITVTSATEGEAAISGNENTLTAVESVTTGKIAGNKNVLTATGKTTEEGTIVGNITTGDIQGIENVLSATGSITTGAITGNENTLDSDTINVEGAIVGNENVLTADTDITIDEAVTGAGNIIQSVDGTITIDGNVIGGDATDANKLTAGQTITIESTLGGTGTQILAYGNGLSQDDVAITIGEFAAQGTDLRIATTSDPVFGNTDGNGSIVIGAMSAAVDANGNAVAADNINKDLVSNIVSNNSYVFIGALNGSNAVTKVTAHKDIVIGLFDLHEGEEAPAPDTASNLTLSGANIVLNRPNGVVLTDSVISTSGSITGTSLTLTTSVDQRLTSNAANVTLTDLEIAGYAVLNASGAVDLENLTINGKNATLISPDVSVTKQLTLKNGAVFNIARLTVDSITISDSTLITSGALSLDGKLHAAIGTDEGDLKIGSTISVGGPLSVGELEADSNSVISALSITTTQNTLEGGTTTSGDITADGGTIEATTGNVEAAGAITVNKGGAISGTNVKATGAIKVGSKEGETITGGYLTANGGTITGASLEAHSGIISAAQGISLDGALTAADGTQITGAVKKATNVTVTEDSAIHGSVAMTGALTLDKGTVDGSVSGATSADLENGSTVGKLTLTNGTVTANDSTITGDISGATTVTLTNTSAKNITLTGKLTAIGGEGIGNISGANGVELTNVTTGDITGMTGELKATGAHIGNLTQAAKLDRVTLKDTMIQNKADKAGNIADITSKGAITLDNSSVNTDLASDDDVRITNLSTVKGNVSGKTVEMVSSTITGTVSSTIPTNTDEEDEPTVALLALDELADGDISLTGGSVGAVNAAGNATIDGTVITTGGVTAQKNATLVDAIVQAGGVTATTGKATINGGSVTGNVTAGTGVDLTSATVNGTVKATNGNIAATNSVINGTTTNGVTTAIGSAKNVTLNDTDVQGDIGMSGVLKVKEGSVISGISGISGNVTGATEATITGISTVGNLTMDEENGGSVTVEGSSKVGNIANATKATITDSTTGSIDMMGDNGDITATNATIGKAITDGETPGNVITDANDVTLTNSSVNGDIGMNGILTLTDGSVGSVNGASSAIITGIDKRSTTGAITMSGTDGDITAENADITGAITGANDVTLTNATAKGIAMNGKLTANNATTDAITGTVTGAEITNGSVIGSGITATGTISVSDSKVKGSVNADSATLTDATVEGSITTEHDLTTNGSVTAGGDVTVGQNLKVNNGSLNAGTHAVNVTGSITLNKGKVNAGTVTSDGATFTDTEGTIGSLDSSEDDVVFSGGSLTINGALESAALILNGGADIKVTGATTASGKTTVTGGSTLTGTTLTTKGLEVSGENEETGEKSAVTMDTSIDLNNAGLTVTGGTVTAPQVTQAGTVNATEGATITGNISGATGVTVTDSAINGSVGMNGELTVTNGTTGDVTGATSANISGDSTVDSLTMDETNGGSVTITGDSEVGNITNATSANISGGENGATTGSITMMGDDADITAENADINGAITGANDVSLTNTDAKDISLTGKLTAIGNEEANNTVGTISGANGVDLTNMTTGDITDLTGELTATGSTIADLTQAEGTKLSSVTLKDTTIENTADITATGDISLDGSEVGRGLVSDGAVSVSGGSTVDGNVQAGTTATVSNSNVYGSVTAQDATLTNALVEGAITTTNDLTTNGNVIAGGDVNVGNKLTVNDGALNAGEHNVNVTGSIELNNGVVQAGTVTSHGAEFNDTEGKMGSLNSGENDVVFSGGNLTIDGALNSDNLILNESAQIKVTGATTANGKATVTGGSTLTGTTLAAAEGLDVTDNGTVKMTSIDLKNAGLTVTNGTVNADVTNAGTVKATEGATITGDISEATGVTVADSAINGSVGMNGELTVSNGTAGDVTGASSANISGDSHVGALTMDETNGGSVIITGDSEVGNITNATSANITGGENGATTGSISMKGDNGDIVAENTNITGAITKANDVSLTNATAQGIGMNGILTVTNGTAGDVTGATSANISGDSHVGALTMDEKKGGSVTITGDSTVGKITNATGATITGYITGAETGSISMMGDNADLEATKATIGGAITGAHDVTLTDATVEGSISASHDVITKGNVIAEGDVTVGNDLTVNKGTLDAGTHKIDATRNTTLNNSLVEAGSVESAALTLKKDSEMVVTGATDASGKVTVTDSSTLNGTKLKAAGLEVKNAMNAVTMSESIDLKNAGLTVTNGSINAPKVTNAGAVKATNGAIINGDVSGATSAELTSATTGAIGMTGANADLKATDSIIGGAITGADDVTLDNTNAKNVTATGTTTIEGTVSTTSVKTKGLTISTRSALNAENDVTADGLVKIDGTLKSDGAADLTGTKGSAITGTVAAAKDVTLGGTLSATGANIGGANVNVKGTLAAEKSTLTGENIAVDGTLDAGKGTVLDGAVSGKGTINKTGGDTLALGGDTDMAGGKVNISDASTVDAANGAHLGTVTVGKGSTLELAGKNATGKVKADAVKLAEGATLNADIELGKTNDKVSGRVDMGGNSLNLNSISAASEKNIADGTVLKVFDGAVTNVNEDIVHNLDTLNAHMEQNGDVVLSKNYKSAGETENQTQTASALASIKQSTLHADSELNAVFDALNHTRSAEEARAALDSLSGAGLGGIQKAVADDAAEHLQTLRSTLQSLAANVNRKFDANGRVIEGVTSSSISGAVTGGTSQVDGNGNSGKYDRNSIGFMLAGAHAVTDSWTFGGDLAMSFMDATCDTTDIDGTAVYADVALVNNGERFHQMGTLGFGLFDFDTERHVSIASKGHAYSGTAKGSTQAMTVNLSYQGVYDLIRSDEGHVLSSVVIGEGTFGQVDAMTEDGLGDAGLRSEFDDVASLTFAAGLRYTCEFGEKVNPGYFAAEALFVASAGDTMPKVNNMFIGGGNGFEVAGPETGNTGVRLNAGVLLPLDEQWGVFGNVTSEFRSKQSTVGGSVGVKYSF